MSGRVAFNMFWLALGLGLAGLNAWVVVVAKWWPIKLFAGVFVAVCVVAALAFWQRRKHRDLET